jgi:hypothetical protein
MNQKNTHITKFNIVSRWGIRFGNELANYLINIISTMDGWKSELIFNCRGA